MGNTVVGVTGGLADAAGQAGGAIRSVGSGVGGGAGDRTDRPLREEGRSGDVGESVIKGKDTKRGDEGKEGDI